MAVTNSPDLAMKMELLRSHGVTREPSLMQSATPDPWYYELPVCEKFYENCISIPLFPEIIGKSQSKVVSALREVLIQ